MKKLLSLMTVAVLAAGVSFAQGIQDDIDRANAPKTNPAPRAERQRAPQQQEFQRQQRVPQQEQRTPQQKREFQRQRIPQPRGQFGMCGCCRMHMKQQYMQRQYAPNRHKHPRTEAPRHGERKSNTRNQQAE